MSWIEDLVAATARHGVQCVVFGGNGNGTGEDLSEYVGRHDEPPGERADTAGDSAELTQLRSQVQKLTAQKEADDGIIADLRKQVSAAQVPGGAAPVVTPTGDNGSYRDQSTDTLGLADESLTNKLIRLGYDTVGKVSDAYHEGKLGKNDDGKWVLKKDWLIDVGMALAGMFSRSGGSSAPSGAAPAAAGSGGNGAGDVPAGHQDRPWLQRLGVARDKQHKLNELEQALAAKRQEYDKLVKDITAAGGDPDDSTDVDNLDEQIIQLEEDIKLVSAHMVSLKWAMGLDPSPTKVLDEALQDCGLTQLMENPKPRLMPA